MQIREGDEKAGKWCSGEYEVYIEIEGKPETNQIVEQEEFFDTEEQAFLRTIEIAKQRIDEGSIGL